MAGYKPALLGVLACICFDKPSILDRSATILAQYQTRALSPHSVVILEVFMDGFLPGRRRYASVFLGLALIAAPSLSAAIRTVPGTYPTITAALAASTAGDEIRVAAGRYDAAGGETFPLELKSGVRIVGADRDDTIIAAPAGVPAFYNEATPLASTTFLGGFTLRHEASETNDVLIEFVTGSATMSPEIRDNHFTGDFDDNDAGLIIIGDGFGTFDGVIAGNLFDSFGLTGSGPALRSRTGALQIPDFTGGAMAMAIIPPETTTLRGPSASAVLEGSIAPTITENGFAQNGGGIGVLGTVPGVTYDVPYGTMAPVIDQNHFFVNFVDVLMFYDGSGPRVFGPQVTGNQALGSAINVISFGEELPPIGALVTREQGTAAPTLNADAVKAFRSKLQARLAAPAAAFQRQAASRPVKSAAVVDDVQFNVTISGNVFEEAAAGSIVLFQFLNASGDVALDVDISDNVVSTSGADIGIALGLLLDEGADTSTDSVVMAGNRVRDFSTGMDLFIETGCACPPATAPRAQGVVPAALHDVRVTGNHISGAQDVGLAIGITDYTNLAPLASCNAVVGGAGDGVLIEADTAPTPDFGGGARLSPGNNTFADNDGFEMVNEATGEVKAENNYWGTTDPVAVDAETSGTIDFDPFRTTAAPCAPLVAPPDTADLTITKSVAGSGPFTVGGNITYELTVSNAGPSSATGIVITDTLPAGVTFVSADPGCTHAAGVVTCTIDSLFPGESATRSIIVRADMSGTLVNAAVVTAATTDPTPAGNTTTAPVTIGPAVSGVAVPTVSEWGLLAMSVMLALAGVWFTRRS
jgi:uncharacterized repeat protein (TIGR01451 family)